MVSKLFFFFSDESPEYDEDQIVKVDLSEQVDDKVEDVQIDNNDQHTEKRLNSEIINLIQLTKVLKSKNEIEEQLTKQLNIEKR